MGTTLYDAFTPHATNISAEGVAFRTKADGAIEIRLEQRPGDDKWYAGQFAGLGVGFRPSDSGRESALDRLVTKEYGVPTQFEYVGDVYMTGDPHGWYECKVFLSFSDGEPKHGEWFPVDELPENMVPVHRHKILPLALAAYKKRR
jgi:hypothetical protein